MKLNLLLLILLLAGCQSNNTGSIDLDSKPDSLELFAPGNVNTSLYERDFAISPGRNEIIFTVSDFRQSRRCLVSINKTGNNWGKKEILSFSGQYNDIEPFFSVDGNKLYFASDRPIEGFSSKKNFNIWVAERVKGNWTGPSPLPSVINTDNDEYYPSITRNNNLYFTSEREAGYGSEDIQLSKFIDGKYSEPVTLDTCINSSADEFNAYISPDEDMIVFSSYGRKDDIGRGDLYYSRKDVNGNWTVAKHISPMINSERLDYCPYIDIVGGNFYFSSERPLPIGRIRNVSELEIFSNGILNGLGNIYRIDVDKVIK